MGTHAGGARTRSHAGAAQAGQAANGLAGKGSAGHGGRKRLTREERERAERTAALLFYRVQQFSFLSELISHQRGILSC
jgi:hypothetical protein